MINDNNIVCLICDTNNYSKNLKCKICSKSICIECSCCLHLTLRQIYNHRISFLFNLESN